MCVCVTWKFEPFPENEKMNRELHNKAASSPRRQICLPVGREMLPLGTWIKQCPGQKPTLTPTNVCARLGCDYSCPNTGHPYKSKEDNMAL